MALCAPLLGVLGSVCEVTARVADREVARQAQAAPEYERWILKALSNENCGPHWMPCVDREPKCAAPSMARVMQQFLSLCQEEQLKELSQELSQELAPRAPSGASGFENDKVTVPTAKWPQLLEDEQSEPSPCKGEAGLSPVEASPARPRTGSFKIQESPACPGSTSKSQVPSTDKRRNQDASPIERIAQAPSPIRAMRPPLGLPDEVPPLPGGNPVKERPELEKAPSAPSLERPRPAAAAAAAAYAQDTIIEPTEEVHVPRPAVEWQSKALFAQPPDSPKRPERPRSKPVLEVQAPAPPTTSPDRKELTPIKVADRIMMFEKIISPSVRCASGAMSSSARMGKPLVNRGSACSTERSSGRAVDGSSLFTPVQPAWARPDVKPKELFRSNSDLPLKPKGRPDGGRPELPKPKAKGLRKPGPPAPTRAVHGLRIEKDVEKREVLKPRVDENQKPQEKKAIAPVFRDPALDVRAMALPPKNKEDNYAISDYGDSEGEDAAERERLRRKKVAPKWCETYLQNVQNQEAVDPDTIFGKVPRFVMDDVFPESLYSQVGKKRPTRRRGSSGDWRRDRLTRSEIRSYKQRMGQKRSWDEPDVLLPA